MTVTITQIEAAVTMFTQNKDEDAERWVGPRTSPEDAKSFFGVDKSDYISHLRRHLEYFLFLNENISIW